MKKIPTLFKREFDEKTHKIVNVLPELSDPSLQWVLDVEGIVFWKDGEPKCKIKRSDFGFPWGKM